MARPIFRLMNAKRALWLVITALCVTAVLPARFLEWAGWFGTLVQTIVVPVSHPISRIVRSASPGAARADEDEAARTWRLQAEEFEALYLRERDENRKLRELMEQMRAVVALSPDVTVRHLAAPVVAGASDPTSGILSVRVPMGESITPGTTVAVVEGVQILGRVDSVRGWSCQVRPITDAGAGRVEGLVILGEDASAPRLRCTLTPSGGVLVGPVEDPGSLGVGESLRTGLRVRLSDPTWPDSAQQLVLGAIERIEPNPDQPLRRMIVVRPLVDLARVSDVVLRIPVARQGTGSGGAQGGTP